MNVGVPTSSFTSLCVVAWFGTAYSMRVTIAELSFQSSNVDVVEITSWRMPVSVPSSRAEIWMC